MLKIRVSTRPGQLQTPPWRATGAGHGALRGHGHCARGTLTLEGVFPFGAASVRCEPRRVNDAMAFVLGVYPSALHVQWTHPEARVAALAVAPHPLAVLVG